MEGKNSHHCVIFALVVLVILVVEPSMEVKTRVRVSVIAGKREGGRGRMLCHFCLSLCYCRCHCRCHCCCHLVVTSQDEGRMVVAPEGMGV